MRSTGLMLHVACLLFLVVAAADKDECKDGVCQDGSAETSALVQSRMALKSKDSSEQKDNKQRMQAIVQIDGAGDLKSWIIEFASTCTDAALDKFCENAECQNPKILPSKYGVAICGLKATAYELESLKAKEGLCPIVKAEPDPYAKAAALQTRQDHGEASGRGGYIIKFESTCTDEGLTAWCEKHSCTKPQLWPSEMGVAMTGVSCSSQEMKAMKAEGGACKIETAEPNPYARAAALQQTEASGEAKKKEWIVQFANTCTDAGMQDFCKSVGCKNPKIWPSKEGYGLVGLTASDEELKAFKAKGGPCKITLAEPNPFAKVGLVQKLRESEEVNVWVKEMVAREKELSRASDEPVADIGDSISDDNASSLLQTGDEPVVDIGDPISADDGNGSALLQDLEQKGPPYLLAHKKGDQKGWIIKFDSNCTDKGLEDFCKNATCQKPQILPSEHGIGITGLKASSAELTALKAADGVCKIDTAEPDPFAKAVFLQMMEAK